MQPREKDASMTIEKLCECICLQPEIEREVLAFSASFDMGTVQSSLQKLKHLESERQARAELNQLFSGLWPTDYGRNIPMLTCMLTCAAELFSWYRAQGISETIFVETMECFPRFIGECREITGRFAFDREWWTARQIGGRLFRLGALEYEITTWEKQQAVGIHIPSGADLSAASCEASIAMAREFFRQHADIFPGYDAAPWICHSWLLAPELGALLGKESRILQFQKRFIIEAADYEEEDYLEWVFRCRPTSVRLKGYGCLPEETSLQKRMKAHLLGGGKIGAGFGRLK